ncbi:hypothetical protein BDV25DRAFT_144874 [Aspergillus avenaceus]|uniref:Involucrin repeat protein n=1 Tax=Aspergillus avenaceus TaxID=36643 RepID=A0A5N6TFT9_ASPAV|nr:hypothetical protein BDV25DRAFT_144874 [Aspergillus avenaceus]
MFKAFLAGGRSSDTRSTSSSQKSSRRRTDSRASSTVSGKSSRGDDRDRGLGDPSTYPSFGTRSKRYAPSAAGDSVASSYATAEPGSLAESDRIIERSPKRRETNDSEYRDPYQDASELDGNPRRRQDRARSPSRERERRRPNRDDHPNEMDNDDHGNRRERKRAQSGDIYMSPTSVAGANLIPDMPGPDHPQFPPPIHSAHPVTSMPSSPNVTGTYDPNAHQQFPGQFPAFIAEPYRPPNPAGEAAEYYGDQGQSVAQQPGVRPKPPTVIPNSQPHLMSASPTANPPPEPSSMGEVGAAAAYYDDVELENQASTQSNYSPSSAAPRPPRPTIQTTGISGPGTAATAGIEGDSSQEDVEFASPALPVEPSTSNTVLNAHNPLHTHSGAAGTAAMGAAAAYIIGHNQQSSSNVGHSSQYSNHNNEETSAHDLEAPGPFAHPSHPGATLYPANAEVPAAYAAHPLHPDPAPLYHGSPFQSGELAFQQRQRGPLDKFIDFWRDPEGVGMFEDYTESIGVCKHCFEPGTTSRDAPRKHEHKPRRRSSDRYSNGSRVDKANRYTSSEDEGRRRKQPSRNSWLPGMLAGYTLKSLFSTKDFEDTYNIRPGRVTSSPQGNESVSTFERRSRTSHGVFRHSYHNSAELSSESHEELRRRSRSRSRSSSRSKKNSRVRDAALGAAIGVTTVRVDQSRDRHGSQSQSPQEAKSRKYSSSDSSFVDISRPARKSVVGGLSSFFTASSENRKKRRTKRRANFLATHNSSSSSSLDADLAFGSGYAKKLSNKPGKQLKKDRKDVDAALLELGAAATALAASSRWKRKSGEARASKGSRLGRSDSLSSASDDIWEDVDSGEQSSSSVSSALAFGGSGIYGSTSQSSESGTSFWGWRWGRRKEKKQKKKDSRISEGHSYTRTAVGAGALGTATLASGYRREGKMSSEDTTVSGTEGLQHVAPISTNDPSRFDVVNVPPFPSQPALVRPGPIPLQQPQPVTPVSQAVYTSQGESIHAYSASPRPPESASHDTSVPRDHGSQRLAFEPWSQNVPGYVGPGVVMAKPNRPPRRSDSLPVFHAEPLESVSVKRRSNLKDQASVQFDLTREQAERERVADRLDRLKRDMGREEGVQLVDRESDVVSFETQHRSRRYYEEHRDSNSEYRDHHAQDAQEEIGSSSAIGAATVGAVGAAAAYLSYEDSSDTNQRHHHERSEKRRAERRYVTSTESAFSSHSFSNRTYSSAGGVSNACHEEGHIKTSAFRDISRKKPIYDDYAQFFAPEELRHSPDMHARPVPPKITEGIEEEPVGEHAMAEGKSHGGLPGPVPELRLIEPTPPQSSTGSSRDTDSPRLSSPKITQDDKNPKSADTGSRVSWGKHEMHEYEVLSTSSEVDSVDHEFTTGPEQERQPISNSPSGWPDDQVKPAPRGVPEDHAADIDFAATVAAATAAAGFDDSLTSHIREELVSSPKLPQSYVEDEVEVSAKYLENQALYSEPESLARGGSVSDEFGFPSSIAQEVLEKLNRKKGPSEASKSAFTEGNTDYQVLRSSGNDGRSESPPAEALPMPGGFDEELSGQGKEHGYMCQISRDDMGSAVVVPVSGDKSKSKKETSKVDNLELSSADENVLFGTGAMSTEARKPPRKRHPRKDSDSPDGCASAPSTPLRVDGISDKNRSVEKEAKEKSFGGILASTLSSEAPEPIGNRLSLSSDVHSALEIRSEIEAKVLNRRDGESTDYRDTVEHLKV